MGTTAVIVGTAVIAVLAISIGLIASSLKKLDTKESKHHHILSGTSFNVNKIYSSIMTGCPAKKHIQKQPPEVLCKKRCS